MVNFGIQLYSLRDIDKPLPELLEDVADVGFEGVEFAYRVYDEDHEAIRETLERTGLTAAGSHVPVDRLEEDREATVELFDSFNCRTLTIPGFSEDYFETKEGIAEATERLRSIASNVAEDGVELLYHNHAEEFAVHDDEYGFELLFDALEGAVGPQVDIGSAAAGGANPAALIRRLGTVPQTHLTQVDLDGPEPTGDGYDLQEVTEAMIEADTEWIFWEYEAEDPLSTLPGAVELLEDMT